MKPTVELHVAMAHAALIHSSRGFKTMGDRCEAALSDEVLRLRAELQRYRDREPLVKELLGHLHDTETHGWEAHDDNCPICVVIAKVDAFEVEP